MIEEALKFTRGLIERVGSVYGERRVGDFRSIDCFLFRPRVGSSAVVLGDWLTASMSAVAIGSGKSAGRW